MIARTSQNRILISAAALLCGLATVRSHAAQSASCPNDDSGLTLPPGFCASIFAEGIGHARHMAISPKGVVYVNTWSGRYFGNDTPHEGGFLVALQDTKGTGKADRVERFGETVESGGHGGSGIALYKDFLFAESNDKIVKYKFDSGSIVPNVAAATVISGLPLTGDHPMHPFVIDGSGTILVDVASATNACQEKNRTLKSPGIEPCVELQTRGGVWRYSATKTDQVFSAQARYASGIRNAEGFAIDAAGRVFVTQHGRDQLHTNWPEVIKDADQEATLPSEEVVLLQNKGDYGWPKCYFDPYANKLVLAPEYGGDGKTQGLCAEKSGPVAVFPAHWAPNDMVYAAGKQFPAAYRNGLFIAFHGSWNRAPYAQAGYNVVYQPMSGAKTSAACEIFADGFSGADKSPAKAEHRPTGLAFGPDGSLYVADDVRGRIYRITFKAGANPGGKTTPCPSNTAPAGPIYTAASRPPEGTNTDAGRTAPIPPGATAATVALGDRIYHGEAGATCTGCHGGGGSGSPLGPDLTSGKWLWSDGSPSGIAATITQGVPDPKQYRAPMPAMGGTRLSSDQVTAVAAYVWTLSHATKATTSMNKAADIAIPGEKVFPESLTSTSDGRVFIGSIAERRVFVVKAGSTTAESFSTADSDSSRGILGVFADETANTLWACLTGVRPPSSQSALLGLDLKSGVQKAIYSLPTAGAFCNDIAVGADGSVYISDSNNMEVDRLKSGERSLRVWAGNGAFGPKGGTLDGIAIIGNRLFVNTLRTNKIFGVAIGADGAAGESVDIKLDRAIDFPDGMRTFGGSLLLVESGGAGRLAKLQISGDRGKLTTIKEGFPGGPVSVAMVGDTGYVLEGQLKFMFSKDPAQQPGPFHAVAVTVGSP